MIMRKTNTCRGEICGRSLDASINEGLANQEATDERPEDRHARDWSAVNEGSVGWTPDDEGPGGWIADDWGPRV